MNPAEVPPTGAVPTPYPLGPSPVGGPGGGSGKDAVTRVSTARTRGFAHTARLVDFAISADGSLAGILVGRKRHHGADCGD